jgi:lipopolysaccharide export system permease protein
MFEIVRTKANVGLREKVFIDDFTGLIIYVNTIPQTEHPVMEGLIITDYRPAQRKPPQLPLTIIAEKGWLVTDENIQRIIFRLQNGSIHSLSRDLKKYQKSDFRIHDLQLTLGEEMFGDVNIPKGLREMNLRELLEKAAEFQKMGVKYHAPWVEIHKKFAIPFAALIFGFLGLAMGSLYRRGEKLVSFAISIAIAIVYYIFLLAGEPLGKQGKLHPFLAMWSANLFFMVLTLYLFRKALTEEPFTLWNRLRRRMPHLPLAWFYRRMRPR